ncbi:MAG: hypothetical protein ACR2LM_03080 [Pyrinomonadaceae bacterium]
MRIRIFVIVSAILGISGAMTTCSTGDAVTQRPSPQVSVSPAPPTEVKPSPAPSSPIRSLDFGNFTYRAKPIYSKGDRSFTLKNGKYEGRYRGVFDIPYPVSLSYLSYGDVTGDEVEEALVVLFENVKGTAIPYYVYVYTLKKGSPKLLWSFETGDRADGGLRQVYSENGELVIEVYGKGKTIGGDLYAEDGMTGGDCCPTHFTRARYQRQGNRFQQKGKEEILSNPVGGAPVVMPRYDSSR